jgi:hypothetical protein
MDAIERGGVAAMSTHEELYVLARQVLLDALYGLGAHRHAVVLVGAQAVYLRVGDADLAVAPFTSDGDLAIDPSILEEIPPLEDALMAAGFLSKSKDSVGVWVAKRSTSQHQEIAIAIDLLVPASVSPGGGRRAAHLQGHDANAARIVSGMDGALVDADVMRLVSLQADDARAIDVRVAGPAALLVSKVHKINDRKGSNRQADKDALDVLRLLRGTETAELASRYAKLLSSERSRHAAEQAVALFDSLFASRASAGVEMAIRSASPIVGADDIAAMLLALAGDLLGALKK